MSAARSSRLAADQMVTHSTYSLAEAYNVPCCEAVRIGGAWEKYGYGPERA